MTYRLSSTRPSNEEAIKIIATVLAVQCAEWGIPAPVNIAVHYALHDMSFYVRMFFSRCAGGAFIDWNCRADALEYDKYWVEEIMARIAQDDRIEIAAPLWVESDCGEYVSRG